MARPGEAVRTHQAGRVAGSFSPREILDSVHCGIIVVDAHGRISLLNPAAERLRGLLAATAVGRDIREVIPDTQLISVLRTGEVTFSRKPLSNGRTIITYRSPIRRNGGVAGGVAVFIDASDLQAELTATMDLNQELTAILEAMTDGMLVVDSFGALVRVNTAFERLTGVAVRPHLGESVHNLLPGGSELSRILTEALGQRAPVTRIAAGASGRQLLATAIPVINPAGELSRTVLHVQDLTEVMELQRQLEETTQRSLRYAAELEQLRELTRQDPDVVFRSPAMQRTLVLARRAANVDMTVLILGETGAGKQVVAKVIHQLSRRSRGPFIKVNCGAIPEPLMESELFGYERGSFTGADARGKPGMFELASGGTLFLDEIGELPLSVQVKLLHALEDRQVVRVGGTRPIDLDVRVIAATNRDLEAMVEAGTFRRDLYYRLNVLPIRVPPLRERTEDIPLLVHRTLERLAARHGIRCSISAEALGRLTAYRWPGNVRELENTIEQAAILSPGSTITPDALPPAVALAAPDAPWCEPRAGLTLKEAVAAVERRMIEWALKEGGSTRGAAALLGVGQTTIVRKAREYGLAGKAPPVPPA